MTLLLLLAAGAAFAEEPSAGAGAGGAGAGAGTGAGAAAPAEAEPPPLLHGPEVLDFPDPVYPPEALAAGIEGTVGLLVTVGADGKVSAVEVLRPAGHGFDEAAVEAVKGFAFAPAEDTTGPVAVQVEFDYPFTLPPPVEPGGGGGAAGAAGGGAAGSAEVAPQAVTLDGKLLEMATRAPIAGGVVIVHDARGAVITTVTADDKGHFVVPGLPSGRVKLQARRPGYQDAWEGVEVVDGQLTSITLWLRNLSYRDNEVVAVYERDREPEVTRRTLSMAEVRRVPGSFGDPVRVIQSLPGAARPPMGSGLLVLRGANPEDSNVFVDGVEVPLVYHLGGFRSILNPDLIESVDYLPGTYSAKYGRSTGGVIDVHTQQDFPEQTHITLRTDLLDTGIYGEGRIGKWGWALGGRHSYVDLILAAALADSAFYAAPRWLDYQAKVQWLGGGDQFSVMLFGFDDELVVRLGDAEDQQLGLGYSTHRLVAKWSHPLSDTVTLRLQPSLGLDGVNLGFGQQVRLNLNDEVLDLRGDVTWKPSPHFSLVGGLDSEASRNDFEAFIGSVPVDGDDPLSESEPVSVGSGLWMGYPDPYLEAQVRPLKDPEKMVLVAGLRVPSVVRSTEATDATVEDVAAAAVDPRFAGRFLLFPGGTLKLGTGLYHQPPSGTSLGGDLAFEQAWSSELGWEQKFTPALQADVTGYYRWMNLTGSFGDEESVGRAYGMEVMVRHALVDRFFGWISYTLSKSERNDTPDDEDGWYPFDYDQTHILTGVAGYRLPLDFEVSAKAQYTTGNPYTPYDGGIYLMDDGGYVPYATGTPNSEREPDYWAVDARVDKLFTWKHWQLELFVDLLNVAHGENPEFIYYNYDYTSHEWIDGLPFIPSFGFQAELKL